MNMAGMHEQVRRAAMTFLPSEANASLARQAPGALNEAGDPTAATTVTVSYRAYLTRMRQFAGDYRPEGIRPDGEQEAIIAPLTAPGAIDPAPGDLLTMASGARFRIRVSESQDIAGTPAFWLVRMERIQ
ncbi:MAG: hypothetical protein GC208_10360 [Alphaproteobacteria bacterium]|nr:hypothetical protein [Alphaproteobacteria bacterium]